jgi:hypothetical protein
MGRNIIKHFLLILEYWAGFLLIPVFLLFFCVVCHAEKLSNAEVDRIFKEIKNIAQETVQSGKVKIDPHLIYINVKKGEAFSRSIPLQIVSPHIQIDFRKKELLYGRGVMSLHIEGFNKEPWDLPLVMLIEIELFREIFDQMPGGKSIWKPYKERGEEIVKSTIWDLLFFRTNELESRTNKINMRTREFVIFINETVQPFDQVARENGLKAVRSEDGYFPGEGGPDEVDMLKVEVVTEPPGGSVKVIPLLVYRVYQSLGRSSDQWPWKSLVRNTELLLGKYRYIVSWPDGWSKEGQLELKYKKTAYDKPEKITFSR